MQKDMIAKKASIIRNIHFEISISIFLKRIESINNPLVIPKNNPKSNKTNGFTVLKFVSNGTNSTGNDFSYGVL